MSPREKKKPENPLTEDEQKEVIKAHMPLMKKTALLIFKRCADRSVELHDVEAYAFMALDKAAKSFDKNRGVTFGAYATTVIRTSVYDALSADRGLKKNTYRLVNPLNKVTSKLTQELGREPTDREVAERLGWPLEKLWRVKYEAENNPSKAIDDSYEEDGSIVDRIPEPRIFVPTAEIEYGEMRDRLYQALSKLTEKQRHILKLTYFEGLATDEVSIILGQSKKYVCDLRARALRNLRYIAPDLVIYTDHL